MANIAELWQHYSSLFNMMKNEAFNAGRLESEEGFIINTQEVNLTVRNESTIDPLLTDLASCLIVWYLIQCFLLC